MTTAAMTQKSALPGESTRKRRGSARRAATDPARTPLTWRSVLPGLASAVLSAQLILILVAVFSSYAVNGPTVVVIGGSMEPNVPKGSVLVAKLPEPGSIKEGTIVVYEGDNGTVTHRVVAASGDGEYITRGDANSQDDSTPLTADKIKGQARLIVPWIGWPRVWWQESNHLALGGWIAILLALVWLSGMGNRNRSLASGPGERMALSEKDPEREWQHLAQGAVVPESESDAEVTLKRPPVPTAYPPAASTPVSTWSSPVPTPYTPVPTPVTQVSTPYSPVPTPISQVPTPYSPAPTPISPAPTAYSPVPAVYSPVPDALSVHSRRCQQARRGGQRATYRVAWTSPRGLRPTVRPEDRLPRRAADLI